MAKKTSKKKKPSQKTIATINHDGHKRSYIPTAELETVMEKQDKAPIRVAIERRNRDLDPQLVWRGKQEQDAADLVTYAPPLYIQEKVHPKVLVDDLLRQTLQARTASEGAQDRQYDLFADFNGLPEEAKSAEFYQHEANWTNRMILGDSLQVMASLAEREGLRGKVQCIYLDPPYGIKFNSNFQWSTTSNDVQDGKSDHVTREPEQVKAFRDTWCDGIHSYLTYLRDRLTCACELLHETGSIFVQIGDENVHRVRELMDELLGESNFISLITYPTSVGLGSQFLDNVNNYIVWYARSREAAKAKSRGMYRTLTRGEAGATRYSRIFDADLNEYLVSNLTTEQIKDVVRRGGRFFTDQGLTSRTGTEATRFPVQHEGKSYRPSAGGWRTSAQGIERVKKANRVLKTATKIRFRKCFDDFAALALTNNWDDVSGGIQSRNDPKVYVVQTATSVIERCLLMATDPGDLVLDPTCGSGTTAYVAEQWGRRWITIDTSRVALALARARIMGARYPYYLLADSREGQRKEAEVTRAEPSDKPTHGNIRHGFVYERVPHITLKSIANNAEIDVIWEQYQQTLEPLREKLNAALGQSWEEWEIPREAGEHWPADASAAHARVTALKQELAQSLNVLDAVGLAEHADSVRKLIAKDAKKDLDAINQETGGKFTFDTLPDEPREPWPAEAKQLHADWWAQRISRQREIDASIAAKADFEYLYDKPYEDKKKVRVAGPFTVESLSPHRTLGVDADDELIDPLHNRKPHDGQQQAGGEEEFIEMILENLKTAGVQQAHKEDKLNFTSISPWPGRYISAEGRYTMGDDEQAEEKRAGVFIGSEFGTVARQDLVAAAREAADAGFDVLVACAFNYDALSSEFDRLGRIPVLKARMNADLHMADDLKNTGKGNLFVIFGEPDIDIQEADEGQIQVKINGVDVFHPNSGEVRSDGAEGIACWFLDTNYNDESFFVRHAYFLGASDPYKSLKTTLKAEINKEAWDTLNSDTSRPFAKPATGRIAVKVINHLGDEVMKVFGVG